MKVKTTAKKSFMLLLALAMLVSLAGFTALNVNKAHASEQHQHEYTEFVGFEWSPDGTTAKAVYQCEYCGDVTEYDAEMSSEHTPATCTEAGYTTYTATYDIYVAEHDVIDFTAPALDHDYQFNRFAWAPDGTTAKAVYQCANCLDEVEYDADISSDHTPATCTAVGYTTYTATYEGHVDTNDVEDEDMLDHDYQFVEFAWSADGKTAKALYRCADCNDEVEYDATMTAAPTTAKCYEDGVITYTATYEGNTDTNDVFDPAHHDYVFVDVTWAADKPNALFRCSHTDDYEHNNDVQGQEWLKSIVLQIKDTVVVEAPTCTEGGTSEYVVEYEGRQYTKRFATPALGHNYQYANFEWAEDNLTANAVYNCSRCTSQEKHEAGISFQNTTEPTCTEDGVTDVIAVYNDGENHFAQKTGVVLNKLGHNMTFTEAVPATCTTAGNVAYYHCDRCEKYFADANGENELNEVVINKLGHNWVFDEFEWAEDCKTAKAKVHCDRCPELNEFDADMAEEIDLAATCEAKGKHKYTASYGTNTEYRIVEDIDALGHDWSEPVWAFDYSGETPAGTATFTCGNEPTDVRTVNATMTLAEEVAPTCTVAGKKKYTATVVFEGVEYTEEDWDNNAVPALTHDWVFQGIDWDEDTRTPMALYQCSRYGDEAYPHPGASYLKVQSLQVTNTEVLILATCTEEGKTKYYTVYNEVEYTKEFVDPALDHNWIFDEFEWAEDCKTAKAKVHCDRCPELNEFDADMAESNYNPQPTCTAEGMGTVTASYTDANGDHTESKENVVLPALGHNMAYTEAVPATCLTDGNLEYYYCDRCQKYFSDENGENELADTVDPALNHSSMVHVDAAEAKCTEAGHNAHYYCAQCGKYFEDADGATELDFDTQVNITALGHNMTHTEAVPATCLAAGNVEYWYCDRCEKYFADENGGTELESIVIDALGHNMTNVPAAAATCTTDGNAAYYYCDRCDKYFEDELGETETTLAAKTIAATGHDWQEAWAWADDASAATLTLTCKNDPEHVAADLEATIGEPDRTEADCYNPGEYIYTATVEYDGKTFTSEKRIVHTEALDHDYEFKGLIWSEDVEDNIPYAIYMCKHTWSAHDNSVPGKEGVLYIPMDVKDTDSVTPATCTEDGSIRYKTSYVVPETGDSVESIKVFTIPALGHTMEGPVAAVAATCTTAGNPAYYHCTACDKYFADELGATELASIVIEATGHAMTHHEPAAATCTTDGTVEYWSCANCNKNFSDAEGTTELATATVTPALGHTMEEPVAAVPATCTTAGNPAYYHCTTCNKYFADANGTTELASIVIAATGHDMTHHDPAAATCTTGGTVEYWHCANCNKDFSDADGNEELATAIVTPALGHTMGEPVEAVPATCTEAGNPAYWYCAQCDKYFADENGETELASIVIEATGHDMTHYDAVDATDTTAGNVEYYHCANCDKNFADEEGTTELENVVLPATGHNLVHTAAVPETCTTDGNVEYWYCAHCNKYYSDEEGTNELAADALTIAAPGHNFNTFARFEWAEDNTAKAVYACTRCEATESYDATVESELLSAATCEDAGQTKFTATYGEHNDTITVAYPEPLNHLWSDEIVWNWSDDFSTVTASVTCLRDASHHKSLTAVINNRETVVNCTESGTFTFSAVYSQKYSDTVETNISLDVTAEVVKVGCETKGHTTFTAVLTVDGVSYTNIKYLEADAIGHDYGEWYVAQKPTWEGEGIEQRDCKHDATHYEQRSIPAKGCESAIGTGAAVLGFVATALAGLFVARKRKND